MAIQDRKSDYSGDNYDLSRSIRLAGLVEESVVDGKGIRCAIFVQGCFHACKGCHNPQTHDITGGKMFRLSEIAQIVENNLLLDGLTFSGGEPFLYPSELADLAEWAQDNRLNIWCYTGYTYEELLEMCESNNEVYRLLQSIDVLVDGRYEEDKRNLMLKFRGSENQRIINLKKMRESNTEKIILLEI